MLHTGWSVSQILATNVFMDTTTNQVISRSLVCVWVTGIAFPPNWTTLPHGQHMYIWSPASWKSGQPSTMRLCHTLAHGDWDRSATAPYMVFINKTHVTHPFATWLWAITTTPCNRANRSRVYMESRALQQTNGEAVFNHGVCFDRQRHEDKDSFCPGLNSNNVVLAEPGGPGTVEGECCFPDIWDNMP